METYVNKDSPYWADLQAKGYCIIKGVVPLEECKRMRDDILHRVKETALEGECPSERPELLQQKVGARENYICQHYGIGHIPAVWDARIAAKRVFSSLWGTDELLTSFDGICLAPAARASRRPADFTWWHTDQNGVTQPGLQCVQGLLTLNHMGAEDLTLGVLEASHALHAEFAAEHKALLERKGHFVSLSDDMYRWYVSRGCGVKRVEAEAGDLVLWDSRTVHCSLQPLPQPTDLGVPRRRPQERLVVYVCMLPRAKCPAADLRARVAAFEAARLTAHTPYPLTVFPVDPARRGCEAPQRWAMDARDVEHMLSANEDIRQLVGYPKRTYITEHQKPAEAEVRAGNGPAQTADLGAGSGSNAAAPGSSCGGGGTAAAVKREKRWKVKG